MPLITHGFHPQHTCPIGHLSHSKALDRATLENMRFRVFPFVFLTFLPAFAAHADVYVWVDEHGVQHYSDQKPAAEKFDSVTVESQNVVDLHDSQELLEESVGNELHKVDNFRMPRRKSPVQHRFSLTSGLNGKEPRDRLSRINIDMKQKQLHVYVKLIGVERNRPYRLRYRILDAKKELIFDKDKVLSGDANSMWFAAKITPAVTVDAPGTWTFQGILDDDYLFEEKRIVSF